MIFEVNAGASLIITTVGMDTDDAPGPGAVGSSGVAVVKYESRGLLLGLGIGLVEGSSIDCSG